MNKLVPFVIFIAIAPLANAQTPAFRKGPKVPRTEKVLRDTTMPAVFLQFVRKGQIHADKEDLDVLFFRLTNNTKWPIRLSVMPYESEAHGDSKPDYIIEESRTGRILETSSFCHLCTLIRLGAGKKLLFSIPFSSAQDRARLRVEYSFGWEETISSQSGSSTHSANFSFGDLPDGLLTKP